MTLTETRPAPSHVAARQAMIDSQLRPSGVNERFVIDRMAAVAREDFVPDHARGFAYMDRAIPLGQGSFLAAPLVHGRMLEEARPRSADKVLLIGNGSGYLAELVRPLVAKIDAMVPEEALARTRRRGEYDLLLIDGAVEQLPSHLAELLVDGARVVTGVVQAGVTRLAIGRKAAGEVSLLPLAEMGIPRLAQFDKPKEWSF